MVLTMALGCKKTPLLTYDTEDNIYFNYQVGPLAIPSDSIIYSFAYSDVNVKEATIGIPIAVTGLPNENDRAFELEIGTSSTAKEGVHYDAFSTVIRAGQVRDTLRIRLHRTADLASGRKTLYFRLKPNVHFSTNVPISIGNARDTTQLLRFMIVTTDILEAGPNWRDYEYYLGNFSVKKMKLMNELFQMPLDLWTEPLTTANTVDVIYYGSMMSRYLADQALKGTPVLEDDGVTPIQMGFHFQ